VESWWKRRLESKSIIEKESDSESEERTLGFEVRVIVVIKKAIKAKLNWNRAIH
jgi:hypothetical protein